MFPNFVQEGTLSLAKTTPHSLFLTLFFFRCVLYKKQPSNTCIPHLCLHGMLQAEPIFHFMLIILLVKNLRRTLEKLAAHVRSVTHRLRTTHKYIKFSFSVCNNSQQLP